jgi:hypothetical protein
MHTEVILLRKKDRQHEISIQYSEPYQKANRWLFDISLPVSGRIVVRTQECASRLACYGTLLKIVVGIVEHEWREFETYVVNETHQEPYFEGIRDSLCVNLPDPP